MPSIDVPWLGERIRAERVRRGVSLRGLARAVGVSASLISQIETAKSRPSVSTLYGITSVLDISVEDLFSPPAASAPSVASAEPGRVGAADRVRVRVPACVGPNGVGGPFALPTQARGPVVRPDGRGVLTLESGVTWEHLGELADRPVGFLLITYPPAATSSVGDGRSGGGLMRHAGTEYGYVIGGELVLTLGFEEFRLGAGDAVCFDSTTPHGFRNDGTEPAVGVWFVLGRR